MAEVKLFNTLTKQKEKFTPLNRNNVGMYVCGPTVYNLAHLGNARAMIVFDALYRTLKTAFPNVTYVRNITDVDDKINKAAKEKNISIEELTTDTIKTFHNDMAALNCLPPDIEPKATLHIKQMQEMITKLIDSKHAYVANNHVLFSVNSYSDYGKLSRRSKEEMIAGARVEIAPYKKDPADFVLWKPSNDSEPGWKSPWGYGRPGWHIECSAMSTQYLGKDFDIHGGGADLQFPHHENEIAQSCCAFPASSYAKFWIHNGFLVVNGEKMSKSLGNFFTVQDILNRGIAGETIRYLLLSSHYRKPLNWTDKALNDAQKSMDSFYRVVEEANITANSNKEEKLYKQFINALYDDLNTPDALAVMHNITNKFHRTKNDKEKQLMAATLISCGQLLGFLQNKVETWFGTEENDAEIMQMIKLRDKARQEKDWQEADRIRDRLKAQGIILEDAQDGTTKWKRA